MTSNDDAVNEDKLVLCFAICCVNLSVYPTCDCVGCSGKVSWLVSWAAKDSSISCDPSIFLSFSFQGGLCCLNAEVCCKPGSPALFPFCCIGLKPECDGCSIINGQCHVCCGVLSCALPCNKEVPVAVAFAGLTVYPKCGFCISQKEAMIRS